MAVPKEKVITALNAKLAGKNVSQKLKDSYATRWADKIETEEDIDNFVGDRSDDLLDAQKEADRRATEAGTNARKEAAKAAAGEPKTDEPEQNKLPDDTPPYIKALMAKLEGMEAKVNGFEASKQAETIEQRFLGLEKVKDKPLGIAKRYVPKTEEEFEAAAAQLEADFAPVVAQQQVYGFGLDKPPASTPAGGNGGKGASTEALDAVMNQIPIKI